MSPAPSNPSPTIDQVIARLDAIVSDAINEGSRLGYFAALYNRVTMAVRDGIRAGAFDDSARMARLDVVFASRYIDAYDQHRAGSRPTLSWHLAFEAVTRPDLSVLQHLFLGMNAHINLDLGIAAAQVAPGDSIHTLEADFSRINNVLAALMPIVEGQVGEISPRFDRLTGIADDLDDLDGRAGMFSMAKARRGAWRFAQMLAGIDSEIARQLVIATRDAEVALVGHGLHAPGPLGTLLGGADRADVAAHIRILARGESGISGA